MSTRAQGWGFNPSEFLRFSCQEPPLYHASPKGSWKQILSRRMRTIHSKAVEVERGVAQSTSILCT